MKTLVLTLLLGAALFGPAAAEEDDRLATVHLPEGFVIEAFAAVPNARQMAWGEKGTLFVGNGYCRPSVASGAPTIRIVPEN